MRSLVTAGLATLALIAVASGCGGSVTRTATSEVPGFSLPLNNAVATQEGTVAAIPMGHFDDALNTFWQTFVLSGADGRWILRTPTGVADNGGLVLAASGKHLVVGFRPSQLLEFSPLASTEDAGRRYATTAVVPAGLADDPDALGVGTQGDAVALSATGVLTSSKRLAGWRTIATRSSIATTPAGRTCGLPVLTAVAMEGGGPVVGTSCDHSGVVGLFDLGDGTRLIGPQLRSAHTGERFEVVRAVTFKNRPAVLIEVEGRPSTEVIAAWQRSGGSWTTSAPLATGALEATAITSYGGFAVLSAGRHASVIAAQGDKDWRGLPIVPRGTEIVAATGRRLDALSVDGSAMTDYRLVDHRWIRVGRTQVPIVYGSSS